MLKFLPYVLKNLRRRPARTVLTVIGAAMAMFLFSFVVAVQGGLAELTKSGSRNNRLVVFQANRFCPSTSRVPEHYARTIREMPGVEYAVPIQLYLNNCRASLDAVIFMGMPPEEVQRRRELALVAGSWQDFLGRQDAALAGSSVAARRGLEVGEAFTINELRVTVVGIFESDAPAENEYIYAHLAFLQRTGGEDRLGVVTQIEVGLSDPEQADVLAAAIDARFRSDQVQTNTRLQGAYFARALGDLIELIELSQFLGFACVGVVLALVANTVVMAVQDRVQEIAVLQTLGFTGGRIFGLVLAESLVVSLLGGLVGVGAAYGVLSMGAVAVAAEGVAVPFLPHLAMVLTGLGLAAAVGIVAGLVPAWQAARSEIVESLRYA